MTSRLPNVERILKSRLPNVERMLRRLASGDDRFDRLLARVRKRDGPFYHSQGAPLEEDPLMPNGENDEQRTNEEWGGSQAIGWDPALSGSSTLEAPEDLSGVAETGRSAPPASELPNDGQGLSGPHLEPGDAQAHERPRVRAHQNSLENWARQELPG